MTAKTFVGCSINWKKQQRWQRHRHRSLYVSEYVRASVSVSEKGVKSHDREQFVEYATKVNEIKSERNQKKASTQKIQKTKVTRTLQANKQTQAHTQTHTHIDICMYLCNYLIQMQIISIH